ncbi:MAG: preprotein translocase subunit SecY [bacterium]
MFSGFSALFSKSNKDLRKRIYVTLAYLGLFCLGTGITIPWASVVNQDLGFLEIFNLMSGGGLRTFSIFALGVSPYITASIVMQILQMDMLGIPYFKNLKDEGYVGKQKINGMTRYFGIALAFMQSYMLTITFLSEATTIIQFQTVLVMTAGTAFCLWMGDQIKKYGIGNGQSMLIMAGIIQSMPAIFTSAYNEFVKGDLSQVLGISLFAAFLASYIIIIIGIIWVQLAERKIPIQYANKTASSTSVSKSFLPIKINSAGVIPVIFASIITTVPATIVALIGNQTAIDFVDNYIVYTSWTGFLLYISMIFIFSYAYTFMVMDPDDMSKNLNERGGYIPGIRPGTDTSKYISDVIGKLNLFGSLFLVILAGIPVALALVTNLPSEVTIGGTGILIVVGVAIETYKQLESSLISRSYSKKRKR